MHTGCLLLSHNKQPHRLPMIITHESQHPGSWLAQILFFAKPSFRHIRIKDLTISLFPEQLEHPSLVGLWACFLHLNLRFQIPHRDPPRPRLLPFVLFGCVLTHFLLIVFIYFFILFKLLWSATTQGQMNGRMLPK